MPSWMTMNSEELWEWEIGKVVLGKHRENKSEVAIKFTDIGDQLSSAHMIQQIYKEAESLKALQHKNIVKQYHAFIEGK